MELSKYIRTESVELKRSQIKFADYNPRILDDEAKKSLKRGIKKFGLVGGVTVNKRTGYTVVSGHQRLTVMDELQKYYHDKLFNTTISRNVKLSEAPGFGTPVYYHDKHSKGSKEYLEVAEELIQRI